MRFDNVYSTTEEQERQVDNVCVRSVMKIQVQIHHRLTLVTPTNFDSIVQLVDPHPHPCPPHLPPTV